MIYNDDVLNRSFSGTVITLILLAVVFGCTPNRDSRPNIVIIYGDDIGHGDIGVYGADLIPTPEIDQLAAEGLVFTNAYSTASTCTPSRYSLLTGTYAFRNERAEVLPADAPLLIQPGTVTLASLLQKAGYRTSVIGKWHLGLGNGNINWNGKIKPGPLEVGFDEAFIIPATNDRVPTVFVQGHYVYNLSEQDEPLRISYQEKIGNLPTGKSHPKQLKYPANSYHSGTIVNGISRIGWQAGGQLAWWNDEQMAFTFTKRAKEFIEENKARPFFLFLSMHQAHVPRLPNPKFRGKSETGLRGDAIVELDWVVGQILDKLDQLGLRRQTLVIFSSDNGPVFNDGYSDGSIEDANGHDPSGRYSGGKYLIFEGGIRVPFIVSWPGRVAQGTTSEAIISQVDLLASMAQLVHIDVPDAVAPDSQPLLTVLLGKSDEGRQQVVQQSTGALAIRSGKWKLIPAEYNLGSSWAYHVHNKRPNPLSTPSLNTGKTYLFNLKKDPGETTNVAQEHPEVVKQLLKELQSVIERTK